MKDFLLDTCVISEPLKKQPNPSLLQWWRAQNELTLFLSTLVVGEIEKGIQKMPPSQRREGLLSTLNAIIERFHTRILPINTEVARTWGRVVASSGNL